MITTLEIEHLRGVQKGRLEGLAPVTLLVGPNGCGKSTVLEALGVACAMGSAKDAFLALAGREWLGLKGLDYSITHGKTKIISTFDTELEGPYQGYKGPLTTTIHASPLVDRRDEEPIVINERGPVLVLHTLVEFAAVRFMGSGAKVNDDGTLLVFDTLPFPAVPFASQSAFVDRPAGALARLGKGHFSSAHRDALTAIKLSPWYDTFFSYLQVLRPKLSSIESIAVGDRDEPHVFERDPRVGYPLAYAGDGFRRSLLLAGTFARAKGGVAALDEPEAYAHPSMYASLTGLLRKAVGDGTQVVCATHSLELVAATLKAFEEDPAKVAVIGLRMEAGVLDPIVIEGEDAARRVLELGHDLRL